jgi:hypothetical protein
MSRPTAAKRTMAGDGGAVLSTEDQRRMIAERAYLRAERRGFTPGGEVSDWLEAEEEVVRLLAGQPAAMATPGAGNVGARRRTSRAGRVESRAEGAAPARARGRRT